MNWKIFLLFPLAALATARTLHAPQLRPALPALQLTGCDYPMALALYLQAYAYAQEQAPAAEHYLSASDRERLLCTEDTSELARRILSLRKTLFP